MQRDFDVHLGKKLRARRRLLGLTQREVALGLGIRFQQIQKYECGGNRLSAERLWRLATILGVSVTYFFEGLDPNPSEVAGGETKSLPRPRPVGANGARRAADPI